MLGRMHDRAARNGGQLGHRRRVVIDAGNGAGRKRAQVMGKVHFQQGFAEGGKAIGQALGRARIEHGERLQHARQVRIAHVAAQDAQRAGDGWIAPGKRLIVRMQGAQFALVILQQLVHARSHRLTGTCRYSPVCIIEEAVKREIEFEQDCTHASARNAIAALA